MKCRIIPLVVAALAVTPLASLPLTAAPAEATAVSISGDVSLDGFVIQVEAQARGSAVALSGQGSDTPRTPPAGVNPGICTFPLSGSVSGNVVTLSGNVTFSTNPDFVGAPVQITADGSTGAITFDFAGFVFTGTGAVIIR